MSECPELHQAVQPGGDRRGHREDEDCHVSPEHGGQWGLECLLSKNKIVFVQETGDSGLNLSVSGAVAEDVPGMVKRIISMVQAVPDWETKWKMISILIGHNDLCSKSCVTTWQRLGITNRVRVEPRDYERNIRKSDR